ncbi:MAG: hypothetical protein M1816_001052 [Peltula sp. TS41687]|nr:MAG: hypothetical protein M1816_001052 [Peltula sp. TS41687]
MEKLTLKPRPVVEDEVECWDDDEDLCVDALQLSTSASAFARPAGPHRDSISSRISMRSDLDSLGGGDEERQVLLPDDDDERSTTAAIASAISAGIPIPKNVPSSALLGGTIKRLGAKKSRPVLGDDWGEDLELPSLEAEGLKIKKLRDSDFPDVLRDEGEESIIPSSPVQHDGPSSSFAARMKLHKAGAVSKANLEKFLDQEGEDDDDFGDVPTIRLGKERSPPKPIPFPSTATPFSSTKDNVLDDFEEDLELPDDGAPLKLSARKEIPRTPAQLQDDFDEWTEGSLGTRHGGTRRGGRSPRSSSISAMSPSVSSSFTIESEDEGLDGLVLPEGPLNLDDVLKKRHQAVVSPEPVDMPSNPGQPKEESAPKDDFFAGIEIGDGDVFDSAKLTLNKNIKHKLNRAMSPSRRTAMTLTFTNKPLPLMSTGSRIPRPMGATLEPVSEVGGPVANNRRTQSRLGGHSSRTSESNIPMPSTPSSRSTVPSTPTRHRELRTKTSMGNLKSSEPTTTNAQLLKSKRSMPVMRQSHVMPSRGTASSGYQRPPSRAEGGGGGRSSFPSRPKTPIDRSGAESSLGHARKPPIPFLPAGTSNSQSHHVSAKIPSHRNIRRDNSESSLASGGGGGGDASTRSGSRARPSSRFTHRSPSPRRRELVPSESLAREAAAKRTLVQPAKRRYFGNGTELEAFDDLPSSASHENRFLKAPIGRGAPKAIRSRLGLPQIDDRPEPPSTPILSTPMPMSPSKDFTPSFARNTAASRLREQRSGGIPMTPMSTNWKTSMALRGQVSGIGMGIGMNSGSGSSSVGTTRVKRGHKNGGGQKKPHLIKPLGDTHNNAKSVKGMHYNPTLYRWEGNENALAPFDIPLPAPTAGGRHPSPSRGVAGNRVLPPSTTNSKTDTFQRPALITNITTSTPSIQVVGGMVFDPQRMCWLKLKHQQQHQQKSPSIPRDDIQHEDIGNDSDDPFDGLDDLDDTGVLTTSKPTPGGTSSTPQQDSQRRQQHQQQQQGQQQQSETSPESSPPSERRTRDEWVVEEFDVGPEFIRRQREEEIRWRKKVESWTSNMRRGGLAGKFEGCEEGADDDDEQLWRWEIRDVIISGSAAGNGGGILAATTTTTTRGSSGAAAAVAGGRF